MRSFDRYMSQYDREHANPWNKALHGIGGGWILLFVGHRIEGNKPAFFQGVVYFLVGPIWIAKEIKGALFGASHHSPAEH